MFANDDTKIQQFFVPALGPAPLWCSNLVVLLYDTLNSLKISGIHHRGTGIR